MSVLGISRDSGAVYVGSSTSFGYRCHTDPYLTPFRLVPELQPEVQAMQPFDRLAPRLFREVYFDPVTRIRRGDVFKMDGSQPARWLAQDPYRRDMGNSQFGDSRFEIEMVSYQGDPMTGLAAKIGTSASPRVALGADTNTTYWKIISIESSVSRTLVLTLKAEQFFGDVPDPIQDQVPAAIWPNLQKLLDDIGSNIHHLSPVAVVDRCRDCLSLIFAEQSQKHSADLSDAITAWLALTNQKENLCSHCGRIVARLHSRGKPNEQRTRNLRPLTESDARLALSCLWSVLVEFGWAK